MGRPFFAGKQPKQVYERLEELGNEDAEVESWSFLGKEGRAGQGCR